MCVISLLGRSMAALLLVSLAQLPDAAAGLEGPRVVDSADKELGTLLSSGSAGIVLREMPLTGDVVGLLVNRDEVGPTDGFSVPGGFLRVRFESLDCTGTAFLLADNGLFRSTVGRGTQGAQDIRYPGDPLQERTLRSYGARVSSSQCTAQGGIVVASGDPALNCCLSEELTRFSGPARSIDVEVLTEFDPPFRVGGESACGAGAQAAVLPLLWWAGRRRHHPASRAN